MISVKELGLVLKNYDVYLHLLVASNLPGLAFDFRYDVKVGVQHFSHGLRCCSCCGG